MRLQRVNISAIIICSHIIWFCLNQSPFSTKGIFSRALADPTVGQYGLKVGRPRWRVRVNTRIPILSPLLSLCNFIDRMVDTRGLQVRFLFKVVVEIDNFCIFL